MSDEQVEIKYQKKLNQKINQCVYIGQKEGKNI
jgi:hypothetical protein